MKKYGLLLFALAFVLVGQGCAPAPETDDVMNSDGVVIEDDSIMEADEAMEEDSIEEDDSMMEEIEVDENADVVVEISGTNFAFSQEEITVSEGDTVQIIFTSEDGFHDWVLDEFDAATEQVSTGGKTSVTFVAEKAGEYEYYCSVGQHRENGMVGTLIVE